MLIPWYQESESEDRRRRGDASTGKSDFEALRRAIEERDAEMLIGFYADDAELRTVNKNTTPSSPHVLSGKEEISKYPATSSAGR